MNAHAPQGKAMSEGRQLAAVRARLAALLGAEWMLVAEGAGFMVVSRDPDGVMTPILRFEPQANMDEMQVAAFAPADLAFLLHLVDRAIAAARVASGEARKSDRTPAEGRPAGAPAAREAGNPKDYAAEAAMKCAEPAFKVFLHEQHGLEKPLTDERVAQKLRSLCGVTLRRDLNDDSAAAARWKELRRAYDAWRKAGR
mgnify:CR=1 FL=1